MADVQVRGPGGVSGNFGMYPSDRGRLVDPLKAWVM
jgi:hypothetical protein